MIAIIPARSGSQGLRNKNILRINSIPLIAHTIKAALKSKLTKEVIVMTDSKKIANISKKYGASVPFLRPKKLSTSKSMVMDTYIYCIDKINSKSKNNIQNFVALLPTSPLRLAEDIDNAIKIFKKEKASSVISVCKQHKPIEWSLVKKKNYKFSPLFNKKSNILNRDEYIDTIIPNGSIYVFNFSKLKKYRKYYFSDSRYYLMPKNRSIDIDDYYDFIHAEKLLEIKNKL